MPYYAIGACYIVKQNPGAERLGGLQVKVQAKRGEVGQFEVEYTDWKGKPLSELSDSYLSAATEGITAAAAECAINVAEFDIVLSRFVYHPVDSHPRCYRRAAQNAFRSAIEGLRE